MSETPLELAIAGSLYRQFNHTLRTWAFLSHKEREDWVKEARELVTIFKACKVTVALARGNEPVEAVVLPFPKKAMKLTVVDKEPA
jgi:hypothetical protein